jgi:dTDP-4-dehydrorhamnose 3,5-epimerase
MLVEQTSLEGVLLITPDTFRDHRGTYSETYNMESYLREGIPQIFVQDDISVSYRNVLRGIHVDNETWKLVSCPSGTLWLAVVNLNPRHPQYHQWEGFALFGTNYRQVLIPPMFGNGHLVTSETAVFHYKQSTYYNPNMQRTVAWNDPRIKIAWPLPFGEAPILSNRDSFRG